MPELLIISGKGGTGKTSLTGAFAHLAHNKVICDLDVDAPDLHLLLQPQARKIEEFHSGNLAVIDPELCTGCGLCWEKCRFDAISADGETFVVDPLKCEGCKLCVEVCPADAVQFPVRHCGQWRISDTRMGPMVHAQLFPGQENSGRLVALLRQQARALGQEKGLSLILNDGPPGIGCPVISSLSGIDLAVVVTEPTPSGLHDLKRAVELCRHFKVKVAVIVNKCDLNPQIGQEIESYCQQEGLRMLANLPHDNQVTEAMVRGKVITEHQEDGIVTPLRQAWKDIEELLGLDQAPAPQPN